jgi:putative ABC transport system permease protein
MALVVREIVPGRVAIPAGLTMLVAFILLIPAFMGPLTAGLASLLPQQWQAQALLAARQIQQRRLRSSLTVGVLVVAISNGLGLGHAILNNIEDVQTWYRRNVSGDYVLRYIRTVEVGNPQDAETQLRARLEALPEVASVSSIRMRTARVADEPVLCVVRDFASNRALPWNLAPQQESTLRSELAAGKCVVSSVLARRLPSRPDQSLSLELQGRTHLLTMAGEVNDYTFGGLAIFLDRDAAAALFDLGQVDFHVITCKSGQTATAQASLETLARSHGLALQSFAELRRELDEQIGGITGALYALLAVGFLVGGFGVANTLAMSVLEQTRELGLLRIVGMSRRQISRLVVVEALFLGLASVCLGVLAGMTTALVIHLCNRALLDRDVPFQFHPLLLAGNVAVCLLVAIIAAWIPSWRASRIDVLSAIAYE